MGHIIRWDNPEKTVIFQQYTDNATKDDLYFMAKESSEMLATVEHTVHLIIDERNIDLILTTPDMKYLEKLTPENQGSVVMIVSHLKVNYKRLINNLAVSVAPHAFSEPYFAKNIEQARQFLQNNFDVRYPVNSEV